MVTEHLQLDQVDRKRLSPMMRQYVETKDAHPDCLLFFRLGDFYELFFDDALVASRCLEIALTARDCGQERKAPMCGVPYHAAETYLNRLITQGFKVAICEQMEDPAMTKGIVRRAITRIVTPGTVREGESLDAQRNNYLVSLSAQHKRLGLAYLDITTYELRVTTFQGEGAEEICLDEIRRLDPKEILCTQAWSESPAARFLQSEGRLLTLLPSEDFTFCAEFRAFAPETDLPEALWAPALSGILSYLYKTQKGFPEQLERALPYERQSFLYLDATARRNLELTESLMGQTKKGSLLGLLDQTQTAMGSRKLRQMLEQPLIQPEAIEARLDSVEELLQAYRSRHALRETLRGMQDLERLTTKLLSGTCTPRDLGNLRSTLQKLPALQSEAASCQAKRTQDLLTHIQSFEPLCQLLERALVEQPPLVLKDGGFIQVGFHAECDRLRLAAKEGKQWILDLETKEKELTGIKNLKIGYNRVFGYYLEVTRSMLDRVPENWIRKQTLAGSERYLTEELKTLEETVLGAQQKLLTLEAALFQDLRDQAAQQGSALLETARHLAELDALLALAEVAERNRFTRPRITRDRQLHVSAGRHPVVEAALDPGAFVPNDAHLDGENHSLLLITGPNMAGKSTYMRQIAQIVILAQMGSFVPAQSAVIGLVDAIYTRIGASDDLAAGQSTFMVEMQEVATILRRATATSLLILDEVGRGTSTYDGLSIATAIVEALASESGFGARALFATHYHELIELEEQLPRLQNCHVAVERKGKEVQFLHQIEPGGSDDSFGIEVAKLAGVPAAIVRRAYRVLQHLEDQTASRSRLSVTRNRPMEGQLTLDGTNPDPFANPINPSESAAKQALFDALCSVEISTLAPLDALNQLYRFCEEAKRIREEET